ncbi:MAG: hypothetical protein Q8N31_18285 [Reyranella sp.]|nr:hypothetical protein [Reyranella sp.]MDP3161966.1 hypothetical protein [Reyranella sp.]
MSHQRDRAPRLTGQETRRIFPAMRGAHPVSWLLRALSLAAMGFLLSVGTAAAHGSHVTDGGQVPAVAASNDEANLVDRGSTVTAVSPNQAHAAKTDGQPCSEDQGNGKHATGCCTMACHAALAALPAGPLTGPHRPALRLLGLSEILHGRSGDRMERPPKLA